MYLGGNDLCGVTLNLYPQLPSVNNTTNIFFAILFSTQRTISGYLGYADTCTHSVPIFAFVWDYYTLRCSPLFSSGSRIQTTLACVPS